MKYEAIDNNLFVENRRKFKNDLKANAMAIFVSNDIMPTNADGSMGFKQNSDLFYLSGIDQEETILVIYPDVKDGRHKEVLFVRETSELIAIWEGAKLNKEQATKASGIEHVYWFHEFDKITKAFSLRPTTFTSTATNTHVVPLKPKRHKTVLIKTSWPSTRCTSLNAAHQLCTKYGL